MPVTLCVYISLATQKIATRSFSKLVSYKTHKKAGLSLVTIPESSSPWMFSKRFVLKNLAKFTEKKSFREPLFLIMLQFARLQLTKKKLRHRCFLVNFAKVFRRAILIEDLWKTSSVFFHLKKNLVLLCILSLSRTLKLITVVGSFQKHLV